MILISKYLVPKGYLGITLYPFIFIKTKTIKNNIPLLNHERIHLKQQIELLVIPFYLLYCIEFLVRLMYTKNWNKAYTNISFEKEAYTHQNNTNYLSNRPFWNFLKYIRKHENPF